MPKFALPTFLAPAPLRAAVPKVAEAGADGVRLDLRTEVRAADFTPTAVRQFKHRLGEHGLAVGPAAFPTRGAVHAEDRLDERVTALTAALRFAAELGCDTLSLRPFAPPAADDPAAGRLTEVLNDLARAGEHVGVVPCVTGSGHPRRWAELLAAVTAGPVGVNLDPAAVLLGGGDPADAARTLGDLVRTVTARDALAESGGGREVPVGRGETGWEELFALLREARFDARGGWVTCDRTAGPDPFAEAARGLSHLRGLVRA